MGGGEDTNRQHDTFAGVSLKAKYFWTIIFVTGEMTKPFFLFRQYSSIVPHKGTESSGLWDTK